MEHNGQQFRIRTWTTEGVLNGVQHNAGEAMRSWEVISTAGLQSYDIMANRKYIPAMRALHDELVKRAREGGNKRGGKRAVV